MASAVLLGFYDIAKKQALRRNNVLVILFLSTALSTLFVSPFFKPGLLADHIGVFVKAALVSTSWISGLAAMELIPLTTLSTIKASRPMLLVVLSVLIFGERLDVIQWLGVVAVISALALLSLSSRKEGINFARSRGVAYAALSVFSGVGSALVDKHLLSGMDPMFLQCWADLYITLQVLVCLLVSSVKNRERGGLHIRFDFNIILIALLITLSDALYFFALKQDGSLLSVVSLIRRFSAVVTFALGALFFKEKNIAAKSVSLAVLMAGVALLIIGS